MRLTAAIVEQPGPVALTVAGEGGTSALVLLPCDPATHGPFIRELTRANFAALMRRTVGWDEARHRQAPRHPERYRMVCEDGEPIGFFAVREEGDALYLQTIQLVPARRGCGYDTALMGYVEQVARGRGFAAVRLRVFDENPACAWYQRRGYRVVAAEPHSAIMERACGRDRTSSRGV